MPGGITRALCIALILRYIGGTPIRGSVNVFSNRLLVARKVGFGGLGGLIGKLLGEGLGSIFRNPLGGAAPALQSAIAREQAVLREHYRQRPDTTGGGSQGALSAEPGEEQYPPDIKALLDAMVSLSETAVALLRSSDLLSGVQLPGDFEYGLSDLLGIALDGAKPLYQQASAPLEQGPRLAEANVYLRDLAKKVIDRTISSIEAREAVDRYRGKFASALAVSGGAFTAMREGAEAVALVQEAAAALLDTALHDGDVTRARALIESIVRPEPLVTMKRAVEEWTRPPDDPPAQN